MEDLIPLNLVRYCTKDHDNDVNTFQNQMKTLSIILCAIYKQVKQLFSFFHPYPSTAFVLVQIVLIVKMLTAHVRAP